MLSVLILVLALTPQGPAASPACVTPDGARLQLEVAVTDQQKRAGLMNREKLAPDAGMVFVFDRDGMPRFWMKSTLIPLDVIWVSASGEVVEVRAELQPCTVDPCTQYAPQKPARAALLVNAGFSAAHGVKAGAMLRFEGVPGLGTPPAAK
jgi:uncharacterized membrane protein (UPF0127 family)